MKWLAEAMLLVNEHPDWSNAEIARRVGKAASTLARSRVYLRAAAVARSKATKPGGLIRTDPVTKDRSVEASDDAESIYCVGESGSNIDDLDARIDAEMDAERNAARNAYSRKGP